MILSVPGSIAVGGSFDGLQLADVLVRNAGGSFHVGQHGMVGVADLVHATAHIASCAGQFSHMRNTIVCCARNPTDYGSESRSCNDNARKNRSRHSKGCGEQAHSCAANFYCRRCSSHNAKESSKSNSPGCNRFDCTGMFLNESLHPSQHFSADIVQLGQSRGQILADGDF